MQDFHWLYKSNLTHVYREYCSQYSVIGNINHNGQLIVSQVDSLTINFRGNTLKSIVSLLSCDYWFLIVMVCISKLNGLLYVGNKTITYWLLSRYSYHGLSIHMCCLFAIILDNLLPLRRWHWFPDIGIIHSALEPAHRLVRLILLSHAIIGLWGTRGILNRKAIMYYYNIHVRYWDVINHIVDIHYANSRQELICYRFADSSSYTKLKLTKLYILPTDIIIICQVVWVVNGVCYYNNSICASLSV